MVIPARVFVDDLADGRRFCKVCDAFLALKQFKKTSGNRKHHVCRRHIKQYQSKDPLAANARARAAEFCRATIKVPCKLNQVEIKELALQRPDLYELRFVPLDPLVALSRENFVLVTPQIKSVLGKIWRYNKDITAYQSIVQTQVRGGDFSLL